MNFHKIAINPKNKVTEIKRNTKIYTTTKYSTRRYLYTNNRIGINFDLRLKEAVRPENRHSQGLINNVPMFMMYYTYRILYNEELKLNHTNSKFSLNNVC